MTQVCRDPGSPFAGSWDRNWWHYKIRDFPSVILQQGGYALHVAAELPIGLELGEEMLRRLAADTARFWNRRALRHGAFEEYYPFEQGYPPLAFAALAMAKLGVEGAIPLEDIRPGLEVAASQLLSRFEAQAANQQVAGTAAAAMIRKLAPELVEEVTFAELLDRTLALQHDEGWFPEYDGPDLGYLTVTMDCLWDLHDATGDSRCLEAIHKALGFVAWFTDQPPHRAGMHNSRNTDYMVPYAIARIIAEGGEQAPLAGRVFQQLFATADQPNHFFAAVDDRYWCHYIGHSVLRALRVLSGAGMPDVSGQRPLSDSLQGSGHARLRGTTATALVSTRKGGIVTVAWPAGGEATDFGWLVRTAGTEWVSHWWSEDWSIHIDNAETLTKGVMVPHKEHSSSPLKHMILRVGSFVAGRRMIGMLKRLLIFKKGSAGPHLDRVVRFDGDGLVVRDRITNLPESAELVRAPRSSKRHVASADSFHHEDSRLLEDVQVSEKRNRAGDAVTIITTYSIR
ncbi:conserved hypothetical protein [Haloferula helveola]|uniref:Heparinase II/III-like protein n=1 Tax=Haloferula helveola TaxID=490095 RepID=A0ABN6H3P4_9BACT|nr:conserved hypothetical protein [Haloferula helveola]